MANVNGFPKLALPQMDELKDIFSLAVKGNRALIEKQVDFAQQNTNHFFESLRKITSSEDLASAGQTQVKLTLEGVERSMEQVRELAELAEGNRKELQDAVKDYLPSLPGVAREA